MTVVSDPQLIGLVRAGSVDAFDALYDRYSPQAYAVARSLCRDDERVEDVVEAAFISIWRSRATYDERHGTVRAWILTVVRRHAAQAVADGEALRLQGLLARLPDAQREVIMLAFYGRLSHTEIADQLGLPEGTVKGRMRSGLRQIRDVA